MGGLTFAGVDGAPTQQGNQPAAKLSPRVGATYAVDDTTVIRGGYGLFYAPWQYSATQHGQIGFSRDTGISQSSAETEMPLGLFVDSDALQARQNPVHRMEEPLPAVRAFSGFFQLF